MATFLRGKYAHHENTQHGTQLASWFVRANRNAKHERLLARAVLETGRSLPSPTRGEDKARGVPILGMGRGAISGSAPDRDVPGRMDRLRERVERG